MERADDDVRPVDIRLALLSIGSFWALYFALVAGRALVFHPLDPALILNHAVVTAAGAGLTLLLYACMRLVDRRSIGTLVAFAFGFSVPIVVAFAVINHATFFVVAPIESIMSELAEKPIEHRDAAHLIFWTATSWYFFIVAWAVLYIALSYAEKGRAAEQRTARFRARAQSAELRALRYQVKPAFLFNTLDAVTDLIKDGRFDAADEVLVNLSSHFRSSLTHDPNGLVTLDDELRAVELYLGIEAARLGERLTFETSVPSGLEATSLPASVIQPIVEVATTSLATDAPVGLGVHIGAIDKGGRLALRLRLSGADAAMVSAAEAITAELAVRFGIRSMISWPGADGAADIELDLASPDEA